MPDKEDHRTAIIEHCHRLERFYSGGARKLLVCFEGNIEQEKIISITETLHRYTEDHEESGTLRNKIRSIVVELLQNALFHAPKDVNGDKRVCFIAGWENGCYRIHMSNWIAANSSLPNKIRTIQLLKPDHLERYYMNTLIRSAARQEKRAGLGLITIVLKSDFNCQFQLQETGNDQILFTVDASIAA